MNRPATYFDAFDHRTILQEYPIGDAFLQRFQNMSRDELRAIQNERFQKLIAVGWRIPFYRRHWSKAGLEEGDIRSLEDLSAIPVYSKSDLMESVAAHPPLGDFHSPKGERWPMVLHTTSGTTGTPQPLIFGPRGREIQSLLLARAYLLQGLADSAVVQSCYGHGMINGGHYVREAFLHYTPAIFLSAGTGVETPSVNQVRLMRDFRVNVLVGFADYIKKLARVARENDLLPGRDIQIKMISGHLGTESRELLAEDWGGPELYDWYGVGDTGTIAAEGCDHDWLYIWEDAHLFELLDITTGEPVDEEAGGAGDMVVTCLYKDDAFPVIRFNTHDLTSIAPGTGSLKLPFRRIQGVQGRSDNMVKLKGINIFPQGVGAMLAEAEAYAGEYICEVNRLPSGLDSMTVHIEVQAAVTDYERLREPYKRLLKSKIGIEVEVVFGAPGSLASLTGINQRQKPVRLLDRRS